MPSAAGVPNVQEHGEIPYPMSLAQGIYTEVGISSSRKSLQPAAVCVSVSITSGRGERLHVIEFLTYYRQERPYWTIS